MSAAQAAKLDAMRRWAVILDMLRLPDGRLTVEFEYLGLATTTTLPA